MHEYILLYSNVDDITIDGNGHINPIKMCTSFIFPLPVIPIVFKMLLALKYILFKYKIHRVYALNKLLLVYITQLWSIHKSKIPFEGKLILMLLNILC